MKKNEKDYFSDIKLALMKEIINKHELSKRSQAETAEKLGISQPKFSDLNRLKHDKFSVEKLIILAKLIGVKVKLFIGDHKF